MKSSEARAGLKLGEVAALVAGVRRLAGPDRGLVTALLRSVMQRHEELFALWCMWEPGAFDPADAAEERFWPRWIRDPGTSALRLEASVCPEAAAIGGWYHHPRRSREEVIFGPYDEAPLTGLPWLMVSRVAPIMERERFLGAVGIDVPLDLLPSLDPSPGPFIGKGALLEALLGRWHLTLSRDGAVLHESRAARQLLTRYLGRARGGSLPEILRARLASLPTGGQATWTFRDPAPLAAHSLRVGALHHPHHPRIVLWLEELRHGRALTAAAAAPLSPREREVLAWVKEGKSNGETASILGLSEHTVRHHLERIYAKLGVENRLAATLALGSKPRSNSHPLSMTPWDSEGTA